MVTSANFAAGFLGVLPTVAPRLAVLGVSGGADDSSELPSTLPSLTLGLPALRHLVLAPRQTPSRLLVQSLLAAQRVAPNVRIDCIGTAGSSPIAEWDALLDAVCGGPGHEATCACAFLAEA
ncbi:hypothetical protein ABPG77_003570 [Micractinium sp. CCAP 211/92]